MGYVEEGIEYLHETSKSVNSGHPLSRRILYLAMNLSDRFRHRGADKDIADAIEHYRTSIPLMPKGHREISSMLTNFARDIYSIFFPDWRCRTSRVHCFVSICCQIPIF
jgi:hypothetical protein